MNNVIEATADNGSSSALGGGHQRTFVLLLATQAARNTGTGAQEDEDVDAEAILTQADEALVLG